MESSGLTSSICFCCFLHNQWQITISLQRFSTVSVNPFSRNANKLIDNAYGCRSISANRSFLLKDNQNTSSINPTNTAPVKNLPEDDHPVEDLVNAPTELKQNSLEINTNKGKLVVTTSTDGTELKNVVLEVKTDKKETDSAKSDDVDDPAKKIRVRRIPSLTV